MKSTIFLLVLLQTVHINFASLQPGNECCRTGHIYSGRNECYMIPKLSNVESDRIQCLLTTTYCCDHHQQWSFCQRKGSALIQSRLIQESLRSIVLLPKRHDWRQFNNQPHYQSMFNNSMEFNFDNFWQMLRLQYKCSLEPDRESSFCCLGCMLGMSTVITKMSKWDSKKIVENLITMDLTEWCQTDGNDHIINNAGYEVCCQETVKTINSTIRWCDHRPALCAHQCHEARRGSSQVQCSCWEGYQLAEDGRNCVDIDECMELTHYCNSAYEVCHNTEGSYQCLPINNTGIEQLPGFEITGNRNECTPGYYYNSTYDKCKDIDECMLNTHKCMLSYQVCINNIGSYDCVDVGLECPKGFRRMGPSTEHNTGCQDIDECVEGQYNCDYKSEICENTIGSFECEEKPNNTFHSSLIPTFLMNFVDSITNDNNGNNINILNQNIYDKRDVTRSKTCSVGFYFSRITNKCEDINECEIGQHNCNLSEENCVNFPGTYSCLKFGNNFDFGKDVESINNVDYDEDLDYSTNDGTRYTNENDTISMDNFTNANNVQYLNKDFRIKCDLGFERNPYLNICEDVDECRKTKPLCPPHSLCQNTIGSFICHCKTGFIKVNSECQDLNECDEKLSHCAPSTRCVNTIGSYACEIIRNQSDYWFSNNHKYDSFNRKPFLNKYYNTNNNNYDDMKCQFGERMINGECTPVVCGLGYFYNQTENRCQDENECLKYFPCNTLEKCTNTVGSYRCSPKCSVGYRISPNGKSCEDVDECAHGTFICPKEQLCKNRLGSYTCECPAGFVAAQDGSCQDINECTQAGNQNICPNPNRQDCLNTIGSYQCVCKHGYQEVVPMENNMTLAILSLTSTTTTTTTAATIPLSNNQQSINCIDINECENRTTNQCEHYCHNYVGSYKCSCRSGYKLSYDGHSCVDEDECQMFDNQYLNQQSSLCYYKCVNTPGSFHCICPHGYQTIDDGKICKDIDECDEDICTDFCLNIAGSYRCISIECPDGYNYDRPNRRCIIKNDDLVEFNKPLMIIYYYISLVSNVQMPKGMSHLELLEFYNKNFFALPGVRVKLNLIYAKTQRYIQPAVRNDFIVRRPDMDRVYIAIVRPIQGPQEIHLELSISLYPDSQFVGRIKALIYIFVSEYTF